MNKRRCKMTGKTLERNMMGYYWLRKSVELALKCEAVRELLKERGVERVEDLDFDELLELLEPEVDAAMELVE